MPRRWRRPGRRSCGDLPDRRPPVAERGGVAPRRRDASVLGRCESVSAGAKSCDRVVIRRCTFASGDDNIALKSGRDEDGRRLATPCRNVVVLGCQAEGRFGFLTCGSEQSGGIENVYAFANRSFGGGVGHVLWVKSNPRRGGFTRNVNLSGFSGRIRDTAIVLTMSYDGQAGSRPPAFEHVRLDGLDVEGAGAVLDLEGMLASPIRDFGLSDSTFTEVSGADRIRHAEVTLRDVRVNGRALP